MHDIKINGKSFISLQKIFFRINRSLKYFQIRHNMHRLGITVVGWYHSHPHSQADPSLRDMDSQMEYQLKLKGEGHIYQPCLGIILCKIHRFF